MNHSLLKFLVVLLLSLAIVLWRGADAFRANIARVLINQTLNDMAVAATERQQQLRRVGRLLDASGTDTLPESGMIPAVLQGLAKLRLRETAVAARWFEEAAATTAYPPEQDAIWVSPWMSIEEDGSLIVPGASELWKVRPDRQGSGTIQPDQDGSATFQCRVEEGHMIAAFEWVQPYSLNYHPVIQLDARVAEGTNIILETRVDGELQRLFTIAGTGDWQTNTAAITGTNGSLIYLIVSQQSDNISLDICTAQVKTIRFLLDREIANH